jgi:DNA transformation protein
MPNAADFVAHVLELMRPTAPAQARAMFGGHGIYAGGPIVAIVIDDVLYFKTDEASRAEFAARGLEPFVYTTRRGEKSATSYRRAPDEALESADAMRGWLRSAQAAALRSAGTKRARAAGRPKAPAKPIAQAGRNATSGPVAKSRRTVSAKGKRKAVVKSGSPPKQR